MGSTRTANVPTRLTFVLSELRRLEQLGYAAKRFGGVAHPRYQKLDLEREQLQASSSFWGPTSTETTPRRSAP